MHPKDRIWRGFAFAQFGRARSMGLKKQRKVTFENAPLPDFAVICKSRTIFVDCDPLCIPSTQSLTQEPLEEKRNRVPYPARVVQLDLNSRIV